MLGTQQYSGERKCRGLISAECVSCSEFKFAWILMKSSTRVTRIRASCVRSRLIAKARNSRSNQTVLDYSMFYGRMARAYNAEKMLWSEWCMRVFSAQWKRPLVDIAAFSSAIGNRCWRIYHSASLTAGDYLPLCVSHKCMWIPALHWSQHPLFRTQQKYNCRRFNLSLYSYSYRHNSSILVAFV